MIAFVKGCINSKDAVCKNNPLPFKILSSKKYSLSPKIGFPMANKCFLI